MLRRLNHVNGLVGFTLFALALFLGALPAGTQISNQGTGASPKLKLGAYDPYGTFASDPRIAIEHIFIPWVDANLASLKSADQYALNRGRSLLITVEPWSWSHNKKVPRPSDLRTEIKEGRYDVSIVALCETVASLNSEVTLRWGHEMDIPHKHYVWAQWEPMEYIASYRHFVDVCRGVAKAVKFMWSPRGEANLRDYYPGDAYVDVIGLTLFGYQKYEVAVYGRGLTFSERLSPSYKLIVGYGKTVYIAEFGCHGNDHYIRLCMTEIEMSATAFPKLSGLVYFNEVDPIPWPGSRSFPDWRIFSRLVALNHGRKQHDDR